MGPSGNEVVSLGTASVVFLEGLVDARGMSLVAANVGSSFVGSDANNSIPPIMNQRRQHRMFNARKTLYLQYSTVSYS